MKWINVSIFMGLLRVYRGMGFGGGGGGWGWEYLVLMRIFGFSFVVYF